MPKPVVISYETARILAHLLPDACMKLGTPPFTLEAYQALREFWQAFNLAQDDHIERHEPPPAPKHGI